MKARTNAGLNHAQPSILEFKAPTVGTKASWPIFSMSLRRYAVIIMAFAYILTIGKADDRI